MKITIAVEIQVKGEVELYVDDDTIDVTDVRLISAPSQGVLMANGDDPALVALVKNPAEIRGLNRIATAHLLERTARIGAAGLEIAKREEPSTFTQKAAKA